MFSQSGPSFLKNCHFCFVIKRDSHICTSDMIIVLLYLCITLNSTTFHHILKRNHILFLSFFYYFHPQDNKIKRRSNGLIPQIKHGSIRKLGTNDIYAIIMWYSWLHNLWCCNGNSIRTTAAFADDISSSYSHHSSLAFDNAVIKLPQLPLAGV